MGVEAESEGANDLGLAKAKVREGVTKIKNEPRQYPARPLQISPELKKKVSFP